MTPVSDTSRICRHSATGMLTIAAQFPAAGQATAASTEPKESRARLNNAS